MPDRIKRRITVILLFCLLAISLFLLPLLSNEPTTEQSESSISSYDDTLTLKLFENELCLFKSGEIIKKYDINPAVLPGEDIKLLSDGIAVKTLAEADTVAEDYDG